MPDRVPLRLLAVGDLMVDVECRVSKPVSDLPGAGVHHYGEIAECPGGTAWVAASHARDVGFAEVAVWGAVGADVSGCADSAGNLLLSALTAAGIRQFVVRVPGMRTGRVVTILGEGDARIMIADPGANNVGHQVRPDSLQAYARECSDILVSGYALTRTGSAQAIVDVCQVAAGVGVRVTLDVVPHGLEARSPALEDLLPSVHTVCGEYGTLARVYGTGTSESPAPPNVQWLVDRILQHHEMAMIRLSNDSELVASRGGTCDLRDTRYSTLSPEDRSGSLDRRLVSTIAAGVGG